MMLVRLPRSRQMAASAGIRAIAALGGSWPGEGRDPVAVRRGHRQRRDHRVDARRLGRCPRACADHRVPVDRCGRQPVRGHHPGPDEKAEQAAAVPAAGAAPGDTSSAAGATEAGGGHERPGNLPACTEAGPPSATCTAPGAAEPTSADAPAGRRGPARKSAARKPLYDATRAPTSGEPCI
jgi:hypothetical protein